MALNTNNQQTDEILDIKKQSLYSRLKTLFSSDTIVRNVGGKKLLVKDIDNSQMATDRNSLRDRFNRIRSTAYNAYTRDFTLSYQAARMDLFRDYDTMDMDPILSSALDIYSDECLIGSTIIPTPDGKNLTLKQLTEKYTDKTERFHVFSYNHEHNCIIVGSAYNPRSKGIQKTWKVTLDDGKFLIATDEHLFLLRSGEYVQLKNLKLDDSVMPFYVKDFFGRGYRHLYNFSKGWQTEHKIVAEQFYRPINDNEVVHHKNHLPYVNTPENLQIMTKEEHSLFHSIGENNPFYGKKHTPESNEKRSKTLKEVFKNRDQTGSKNPKFREDLTIDVLKIKATEYFKETGELHIWKFADIIGYDYSTIQTRLKNNNYNWNTFKNEITSTLNHKITSIEYYGEEEVFDISVDKYNNFATDSCFVHNCVTANELGKILTVHCENNNIKEILYNLYEEILHVDFNLWSWTRNMVKYGDFFLKLYTNPEYGVYMVEPISAYNVERIENSDPYNKKYVKFQIRPTDTSQAEVLERYQMAHFRLQGDSNMMPYGKSIVEGARRVWKQLSLLEDAMLIHRVVRAPERRIFYTDIGGIPPAEVDNFMQKLMDKMKKVPYMDERTGEYNLKYNLQNMLEDFYIPVRGGDSGTKIDTLSGMEWTGIDDVDYIKNKLFAALKIPKAFLTFDEATGGKANLSAEDLRFARTIQRIQKLITSELKNIGIIHLYAQGYRDESLIDFTLELTNSSTIFEKEKIEIWASKTSLAADMMDNKLLSRDFIYRNVFKMSDDDIEKEMKGLAEDAKQKFRLESIESEGDDPAKPFKKIGSGHADKGDGGHGSSGGGGGHAGGGLGSLDGLGGDETPEKEKEGETDKEEIPQGDEEEQGSPEDIVKEDKERDQSGEHDANDHPFGEDPLGHNEMNRKPRKNSEGKRKSVLYHNFENDSPLSLEEIKSHLKPAPSINRRGNSEFITMLGDFFNDNPIPTILSENVGSSLMDVENIKE